MRAAGNGGGNVGIIGDVVLAIVPLRVGGLVGSKGGVGLGIPGIGKGGGRHSP